MKNFFLSFGLFALIGSRLLAGGWGVGPPHVATPGTSISGVSAWGTANSTPCFLTEWYQDPSLVWHGVSVFASGSGTGLMPSSGAATMPPFTVSSSGTYTLSVYASSNSSVTGSSPSGILQVSQTIFVTTPITGATIAPLTYNGAAQSPSSASVSPAGATATVSAPAQVNAGTYNSATVTGTGNYSGTLSGVPWTINPISAFTPTISASANPITNGSGAVTITPGNGTTGYYAWLINGVTVSNYNGSSWSVASGSYSGGTWAISGLNLILTPTSVTNFTINFADTGNGNYSSATSATLTETVNPAGQSLSWTAAPGGIGVGGAAAFTAAGSATGIYVWSVSPSGPTGISGNGGSQTITFPAGGTFTVSVYSAGNANYSQSPTISSSISVDVPPTVGLSVSPATVLFGQSATVTFTATQNSAALRAHSSMLYVGGSQGWATIPGVNYDQTGWPGSYPNDTTAFFYSTAGFPNEDASGTSSSKSFVITAKSAGTSQAFGVWAWDVSYQAPGYAAPAGLITNKATPTAIFKDATKTPQSGATFSATAGDFTATFANADSATVAPPAGTVSYTIAPGSANGTVNSSVVAGTTFTAGLGYLVRATYAGDSNYNSRVVDSAWTISKANQSITFNNPGPQSYGTNLTLIATASSGLPVSYTVTGGPATVSGNVVTFTGVGSVTITASQAGNANYNAAPGIPQSFMANQASQSITFPQPAAQTYGTPLTLTATASSGLAVTYAITSGPATVAGSSVTFTGVGAVTITASQAGNANYASAPGIARTFQVNPAPATFTLSQISFSFTGSAQGPTIVPSPATATFSSGGTLSATAVNTYTATATANGNFTGSNSALNWSIASGTQTITFPNPGTKSFGTPLTLTATASSGLPVTYSVTSGPATVSGSTATFTGVGSVTIRASQSGNSNYGPATPVNQSFNVGKGSQTITFNNPGQQAYGTPLNLSATASSGLAVTYTVASGPATVSGSTVTFTGVGSVTITAAQAGNTNWNAATSVNQSFNVVKGSQTITFNNPGQKSYGTPLNLSATASSGLAVSYSVASGPATVVGSTVTFTGVGSVTVTASQAGNTNWNAATSVNQSFNVVKGSQTITFNNPGAQTFGGTYTFAATASSGLAVSYGVTSGPATIAGNTATFTGVGSVTITASQAGNTNWNAATSVNQSFNVGKVTPNGTFTGGTLTMLSGVNSYFVTSTDLNATFVHPTNGTVAQPTGTITYTIATGSLTGVVGSAIAVGTPLSVGNYLIQANFPGDTNYNAKQVTATWLVELLPTIATQLGLNHPSDQATKDSGNSIGLKVNKPQ